MDEEFEDTKGVIRIRISKKNRQHNDQKKSKLILLSNVKEENVWNILFIYKKSLRYQRCNQNPYNLFLQRLNIYVLGVSL